jgi:hypothetical protein
MILAIQILCGWFALSFIAGLVLVLLGRRHEQRKRAGILAFKGRAL